MSRMTQRMVGNTTMSSNREAGISLDLLVPQWSGRAACTSHPHLFHAPDNERREEVVALREATAKAICATCPVLLECRTEALEGRDQYAILGGLTPPERANLRRRKYPRYPEEKSVASQSA